VINAIPALKELSFQDKLVCHAQILVRLVLMILSAKVVSLDMDCKVTNVQLALLILI